MLKIPEYVNNSFHIFGEGASDDINDKVGSVLVLISQKWNLFIWVYTIIMMKVWIYQ